MKAAAGTLVLVVLAVLSQTHANEVSPIAKVIQLVSDLQRQVTKEGAESQKVYEEFAEWCEDRSRNLGFEIKTGKGEVADLKATIEEETALAASLTSQVEELTGAIATDEADLKAATGIRANEAATFAAEEKDLMETVDALERAIAVIERGMKKGASMMQTLKNAGSVTQAIAIMVQASALSSADAGRLTALLQSLQESNDSDGDASLGAPAAAVYKGHSGGIVDTLEELMDKATAQLEAARGKETAALHDFQMLKQSLEDEIKVSNKDMKAAKKGIAASGEKKSNAEGDLGVTTKELNADTSTLADLHHDCMTKADEFEAEVKSRDEELKALTKAKAIIVETTSGADSISYGLDQVSLLQINRLELTSGADLAHFEAVRFIRDLARKQNMPELAQLAKRMASAMRASTSAGQDPFAKIKGLIQNMIEKLESEAGADASHKAYCDTELGESTTKKGEKEYEINKLTAKIDSMSSKSAQLKEEVAALQKALAALASSQATMNSLRQEEHALYVSNKAEMEKGLDGVKQALVVLTEYYSKEDKSHSAGEGAGNGIIGLLEVCESDFSTGLAEIVSAEDTSANMHEQETYQNEIEKTTKEQDVKYKTKESKDLDKAVAEATSDRSGVQTELAAVNEYLVQLKEQCIAKAEPYAERRSRREAEIAGLKEALSILENEAALIQKAMVSTRRGAALRGVHRRA